MIPLSILDLAVINEGSTISETIKRSRELVIHAEKLGYNRFWMAEHHNAENIASSATSILLGYMAEATEKIRIGSGGVMLPNHSPLIIAEQFGTLESIYPGRIDLGLGRAPGTDQLTANAIRPDRMQQTQQFPQNVRLLQQYLSRENKVAKVRAIPGEGTEIPIWILGSSTDSAYLAAEFGLPYAFASHFAPQQLMHAIEIYRNRFKASAQLKEPYLMLTINAILSDTDEQAAYLASSMKQMFVGVITGERKPLQPPRDNIDEILNVHYKMAIEQMLSCTFTGSKEKVSAELHDFIRQTGADEIMVASYIYDFQEKLRSYQLLAEVMEGS